MIKTVLQRNDRLSASDTVSWDENSITVNGERVEFEEGADLKFDAGTDKITDAFRDSDGVLHALVLKQREQLRILLHTDAAQALGKIRVDACELGVDYLTIVGHKVSNHSYKTSLFVIWTKTKQKTNKQKKHCIDMFCYISSSMPLGLVLCM